MLIDTKFNIGDSVFVLLHEYRETSMTCPVCNNAQEVHCCDGREWVCAVCFGKPIYSCEVSGWIVQGPRIIKDIDVRRLDDPLISFQFSDCGGLDLGSLFINKKDAEEECARRNSPRLVEVVPK